MTQSGSTEPRYVPATFADRVTALNMVHAVMAAIIARDKKGGTGLGQSVEVPMFECLLQFVLGEHLGGETWQPPHWQPWVTAGCWHPIASRIKQVTVMFVR